MRSGFWVSPAEMETRLAEHPFISDVCVVDIPHEFHRELPFAFVVAEKKAASITKYPEEEAKLKEILAKHVTSHKAPRKALSNGIEFMNDIPGTDFAGKLLRPVVRENAKKLLAERAERPAAAKPVAA